MRTGVIHFSTFLICSEQIEKSVGKETRTHFIYKEHVHLLHGGTENKQDNMFKKAQRIKHFGHKNKLLKKTKQR